MLHRARWVDLEAPPPTGAGTHLFKYFRGGFGDVDDLDFRLLAELSRDPLATHRALAQAIDRSTSAVRKRLAGLREGGTLAGFVAYPTAGTFGRVPAGASWEVELPLADLLALPDVVYAADAYDGMVGALAYTEDPAGWQARADEHVGQAPLQHGVLPFEEVATLGPLDWRVLDAMVDHPVGTLRELSEHTGLSTRTVGARRQAMREAGAVKVEPLIRPAGTGELAYHLNVVAPRERWPAVQALLEEAIVIHDIGESLYLLSRAPDLGTHARRIAQLEALDGVQRVDVVLNRDFALATERLHGWITEELARWEAARR